MTVRHVLRSLHLYVGLTASLFLAVVALTGSILAFQPYYDRWVHSTLWSVSPDRAALEETPLAEIVMKQLGRGDSAAIHAIGFAGPATSQQFQLSDGRTVFVDPYRGVVLAVRERETRIGKLLLAVRIVHVTLVSGAWGRWIVDLATALVLLLVPSGVLLWWKHKRTSVAWRGSWRRINFDVHRVFGIVASPLVLLLATTGFFIAFEPALHFVTRTTPALASIPPHSAQQGRDSARARPTIDQLLAAAQRALPGEMTDQIVLPANDRAAVRVLKIGPNGIGHSTVFLDQYTGVVLRVDDYVNSSAAERAHTINQALHMGSIGGLAYRSIIAAASVCLAVLSLTGVLIWFKRARLAAVSAVCFCVLARSTVAGAQSAPISPRVSLPSTSGRYAVGRRTFYVLDSARTDPHAIRADGKREFMMIVWYPAVPGNVLSRSAWLPAAWEDSAATDMFAQTRRASPPPTIEVVRATIRSTTSRSRDSAAVSPGAEKFPVLIFSPGNVVMPSYYASIAEELASHGYVVIGHVPTGYSRNVVLPDGRVFPRRDYADIDPWIGDVRYIVDHLSRWNADPVYPLFHRLDTLRIGLYGHSGGANAVEVVSSSDSRVRAIAALDPGLTDTAWATSKPTLFLLAENKALFARDTALSSSVARERRDFARHAGNAFWITIRGTEHMSFADISAIPAFQLSADGPAHIAASRRVLLEFFDESLRGVRSNVLREAGAREAFIRVDKP